MLKGHSLQGHKSRFLSTEPHYFCVLSISYLYFSFLITKSMSSFVQAIPVWWVLVQTTTYTPLVDRLCLLHDHRHLLPHSPISITLWWMNFEPSVLSCPATSQYCLTDNNLVTSSHFLSSSTIAKIIHTSKIQHPPATATATTYYWSKKVNDKRSNFLLDIYHAYWSSRKIWIF